MPEASALKTYRVFISHAWKYDDDYTRMFNMLKDAPRFQWANYSVPEHDPAHANNDSQLKKELDDQIRPVGILVILAGMYANYSKWIQYELDKGLEWNRPLLGVKPWGQQKTPQQVADAVDRMVGWNTSSVVDAIRDLHD